MKGAMRRSAFHKLPLFDIHSGHCSILQSVRGLKLHISSLLEPNRALWSPMKACHFFEGNLFFIFSGGGGGGGATKREATSFSFGGKACHKKGTPPRKAAGPWLPVPRAAFVFLWGVEKRHTPAGPKKGHPAKSCRVVGLPFGTKSHVSPLVDGAPQISVNVQSLHLHISFDLGNPVLAQMNPSRKTPMRGK